MPRLVTAYYAIHPDPDNPAQRVAFGTSGHRGCAFTGSFNDDHIPAITQAIVDYRREQGITGPLFLAQDTHALSEPAFTTALEVLAANGVDVMIDDQLGYTPTPALSHAILTYKPPTKASRCATASSSRPRTIRPKTAASSTTRPTAALPTPPQPSGSRTAPTQLIADRLADVKRITLRARPATPRPRTATTSSPPTSTISPTSSTSTRSPAPRSSSRVDPLGGAGVHYWPRIAEQYMLPAQILNPYVDPTFRFMTLDWDGAHPHGLLLALRDGQHDRQQRQYDVAWACDTDHDRHGIVTRTAGLLNPNHYLAVSIQYLFTHRPEWSAKVGIGKTLVSSSIIDRVAKGLGRPMLEVPVGFKWFVDGLIDGTLGFVGEDPPAPASSAATALSGPPTRTASSWACSPRK